MNAPIRRLSVVALVLILTAMLGASWIQFVQADSLNANRNNVRTLYRDFGGFRGPIVVDGESIVYSTPVDDYFNYQRTYTDGALYAPITGYYSISVGRSGIERTDNALLSGAADELFWSRLGDLLAGREQEGASVELTIRGDIQRAAAKALGDQKGAVVVLDPRTGEILAMVSSPSYDPAALAEHNTPRVNTAYSDLAADSDGPLVNRAIAGDTYAPGSLFKLVTAAAVLEAGSTPDTVVSAPRELALPQSDKTIQNFQGEECDPGKETTTLAHALAQSCNTVFAGLAMELGWDAIARKAKEFGWGAELDVPLRVTPSRLPDHPDAAQTAMSAIGQFDVRATPLQIAMVVSAIANDGVLMTPYMVSEVRAPDLSLVEQTKPSVYSRPLSVEDANYLRDMMVLAVDDGTGVAAQLENVSVAGKTGTAESGDGSPPHAWFAGFAPAGRPSVVVVVFVENGGDDGAKATGGRTAAPIAQEILVAALKLEAQRAAKGIS